MVENMKLNNENLQILLKAIRQETNKINNELTETDIDNITLDDLIHHKSNIQNTLCLSEILSKYLEILNIVSENYFYAKSAIEANEQIKERTGKDNEIALTVANFTTSEVETRITAINNAVNSYEFQHLIKLDKEPEHSIDNITLP